MIVTGVQPSGSIHIGNLLGAIRPLVERQQPAVGSVVFIADYHAITAGHDPTSLRQNTLQLAAMLIASGIDSKTSLFKQSAVPAHTELQWILSATAARTGWLNRMIQFKEKLEALGENSEGPSVGLYAYPVLQAADILLYQADEVPVGEDQLQHLNLTIDIAKKFNREFGNLFTVPKAVMSHNAKRIMSLTEPTKKMSKSDPNAASRIDLTDTRDVIAKKVKGATTDAKMIGGGLADLDDRPGLKNLLTIYAAFEDVLLEDALVKFTGCGFGELKSVVAEVIIEGLRTTQQTYHELMRDPADIAVRLNAGAEEARALASATMTAVRTAIGVD